MKLRPNGYTSKLPLFEAEVFDLFKDEEFGCTIAVLLMIVSLGRFPILLDMNGLLGALLESDLRPVGIKSSFPFSLGSIL